MHFAGGCGANFLRLKITIKITLLFMSCYLLNYFSIKGSTVVIKYFTIVSAALEGILGPKHRIDFHRPSLFIYHN